MKKNYKFKGRKRKEKKMTSQYAKSVLILGEDKCGKTTFFETCKKLDFYKGEDSSSRNSLIFKTSAGDVILKFTEYSIKEFRSSVMADKNYPKWDVVVLMLDSTKFNFEDLERRESKFTQLISEHVRITTFIEYYLDNPQLIVCSSKCDLSKHNLIPGSSEDRTEAIVESLRCTYYNICSNDHESETGIRGPMMMILKGYGVERVSPIEINRSKNIKFIKYLESEIDSLTSRLQEAVNLRKSLE